MKPRLVKPTASIEGNARRLNGAAPASLRFAEGLALLTSRRNFLKRVLQGAFVMGASGVLMSTVFEEHASAAGCGPAPYCKPACCPDSITLCHTSYCKKQHYNTGRCEAGGNCWSKSNTLCCDCCCKSNCPQSLVGTCNASTCGSGYWKCICNYACCGPAQAA